MHFVSYIEIFIVGTWTNWNNWSTCSVQCGSGIQIRKRSCSKIQETSCEGSTKEIKSCTINNCSSKNVISYKIMLHTLYYWLVLDLIIMYKI